VSLGTFCQGPAVQLHLGLKADRRYKDTCVKAIHTLASILDSKVESAGAFLFLR